MNENPEVVYEDETPANDTVESVDPVADDEVILPDGWTEKDDIFSPGSWNEAKPAADEQPTELGTKEDQEVAEDGDPTDESILTKLLGTEREPEQETPAEESNPAPTTEPAPPTAAPTKLKFTAKFDHETKDVELDETELPTIYQKAQYADRAQQKMAELEQRVQQADKLTPVMSKLSQLAKIAGFDSEEALVENALADLKSEKVRELVEQGTSEIIAKDYVDRLIADAVTGTRSAPPAEAPSAEPTPAPAAEPPKRDFQTEVVELLQIHPELTGTQLPQEVVDDAIKNGTRVSLAYVKYAENKAKAERANLLRENQTLKQNAASAAKAPVKGVSKDGVSEKADDPFLKGFLSDD